MTIVELRKQRNEAIKNAINGEVYIKKNGRVEFIDINDLKINVNGVPLTFNQYFKGIADYKSTVLNDVKVLKAKVTALINESQKERSYTIVTEDGNGFIDSMQLMIQPEDLPDDILDGYYRIENGIIVLDEARKQELYDLD